MSAQPPPPPPPPVWPPPPPEPYYFPPGPTPPRRGRSAALALIAGVVVVALVGATLAGFLSAAGPLGDAPVPPARTDLPPALTVDSPAARVPDDIATCLARDASLSGLAAGVGEARRDQGFVTRAAFAVQQVRELDFDSIPTAEFISAEEMAAKVAIDESDRRELKDVEPVLVALGLARPDVDLAEAVDDLVTGSVIGLYQPHTDRLFVTSAGTDELEPAEELTLIHELDHALVDQVRGIKLKRGDDERAFAYRALVEGDAELASAHYLFSVMDPDEQASVFASAGRSAPSAAGVPTFVQRGFGFPYNEGVAFVCDLWARGGWEAVDDAFRDPPTTTAQILFPERYRSGDEGTEPPGPVRLAGYEREDRVPLGAADLLFLFESAPGDGGPGFPLDIARSYAGTWDGGAVDVYRSRKGGRGDVAVAMSIVPHEAYPSGALCTALRAWYELGPGPELIGRPGGFWVSAGSAGPVAGFACSDDLVVMVVAPDASLAREMLSGFRDGPD